MNVDQFKALPQPVQDDVLGHLLAIFTILDEYEAPAQEHTPPDTSGVQTSGDLRG